MLNQYGETNLTLLSCVLRSALRLCKESVGAIYYQMDLIDLTEHWTPQRTTGVGEEECQHFESLTRAVMAAIVDLNLDTRPHLYTHALLYVLLATDLSIQMPVSERIRAALETLYENRSFLVRLRAGEFNA